MWLGIGASGTLVLTLFFFTLESLLIDIHLNLTSCERNTFVINLRYMSDSPKT